MATFVFLHGSFHAAWNWHKTLPLLERQGHRGIALDLPGHGRDRTRSHRVTLKRCVDEVVSITDALPDPVILVAHSRNGIVISQAAERIPQKIAGLVYLAAYLVPHGRSMMEYALLDEDSLVVQNVAPRLGRPCLQLLIRLFKQPGLARALPHILPDALQAHRLNPAVYKEALHDCTDDITALAHSLLQAEPNWAGFTPLQLSAARYGTVPKIYIECLQDRAVTLALQRKMLQDTPCDHVFSLDTSHSPFFSQPHALTELLEKSIGIFQA